MLWRSRRPRQAAPTGFSSNGISLQPPYWTGIATRALGSEPVHTPARPRTSRQMTPPAARTEPLGCLLGASGDDGYASSPGNHGSLPSYGDGPAAAGCLPGCRPCGCSAWGPAGIHQSGASPQASRLPRTCLQDWCQGGYEDEACAGGPALFVLRQAGSEETGCSTECGSHPFWAWAHDRTSECRGTRCGSPMRRGADGDRSPGRSSGILPRWPAQSARSRQHRGRRLRSDRCGGRTASNGSISPYGCKRTPALLLGGEPDSGWLCSAGVARAGIFPLESPINGKFAWAVVRPGQFPLDQQLLGRILFGSTRHRRTEWRSCLRIFHLYSCGVSVHMPVGCLAPLCPVLVRLLLRPSSFPSWPPSLLPLSSAAFWGALVLCISLGWPCLGGYTTRLPPPPPIDRPSFRLLGGSLSNVISGRAACSFPTACLTVESVALGRRPVAQLWLAAPCYSARLCVSTPGALTTEGQGALVFGCRPPAMWSSHPPGPLTLFWFRPWPP